MQEAQENKTVACDHHAAHGSVSQNVVVTATDILIICTHNCALCGKLFTNVNPVALSQFAREDKKKLVN